MESVKITKAILASSEWIDKFEPNTKVSRTDKETMKEFRDGLQKMKNQIEELTKHHENEQDPARKEELSTAIKDSSHVQIEVEKFIDDCGIEKHEGWTTIVGDARDVTFVHPPPSPLFFRGFFNNTGETTLVLFDIEDGNRRREVVNMKNRNV